jgi:hypothetical protein
MKSQILKVYDVEFAEIDGEGETHRRGCAVVLAHSVREVLRKVGPLGKDEIVDECRLVRKVDIE